MRARDAAGAPARLSLAKLQRWFQDEVDPARTRTARAIPADRVIRPSPTLAPAERVAIYARMIVARFLACLEQDFPTVRAVAGERAFERIARAYLAKHPSRHYSLNGLGRRLPAFLVRAAGVRRRALLRDIARVEVAIGEVFDEAEAAPLTAADLAAIPTRAWSRTRRPLVSAARLLALEHPVNALVTEARHGRPLPRVRRERTWILVWRRDMQVWRSDLTRPQFEVLRALAGGATIGAALARAGSAVEPAEVATWFAGWAREGVFASRRSRHGAT